MCALSSSSSGPFAGAGVTRCVNRRPEGQSATINESGPIRGRLSPPDDVMMAQGQRRHTTIISKANELTNCTRSLTDCSTLLRTKRNKRRKSRTQRPHRQLESRMRFNKRYVSIKSTDGGSGRKSNKRRPSGTFASIRRHFVVSCRQQTRPKSVQKQTRSVDRHVTRRTNTTSQRLKSITFPDSIFGPSMVYWRLLLFGSAWFVCLRFKGGSV